MAAQHFRHVAEAFPIALRKLDLGAIFTERDEPHLDQAGFVRRHPHVKIHRDQIIGAESPDRAPMMFGIVMRELDDLPARSRIDVETLWRMTAPQGHGPFVQGPPASHFFDENLKSPLLTARHFDS